MLITEAVQALEYIVHEKFWLGSMKRYADVGDVLRMDCLTSDILVKYSVLMAVAGLKTHEYWVNHYRCIVAKPEIKKSNELVEALKNARRKIKLVDVLQGSSLKGSALKEGE